MAKYNEAEQVSNNINLIGFGTEINGDITCNGDLRIDGTLIGNIQAKGKIVVGETGRIKGEVSCKNSDISGTIDGKVIVGELLALKSTARINGDIVTSKLAIEPGSRFTGYCDMTGEGNKEEVKPFAPVNKETKA